MANSHSATLRWQASTVFSRVEIFLPSLNRVQKRTCNFSYLVGKKERLDICLVWPMLSASATLAGLPSQLMDRLQSVQNAAARLIFSARCRNHVQPLIRSLHWLRVPQRTSFRLAVLVYRCLHASAPGYLVSELQRVSDLNARRRLRSSSTSVLVTPRTVRATIGDRAFLSAAASIWNSLPESVRGSPTLPVFRNRLKTELFARSFS